MAGSIKAFVYTDDAGEDWGIRLDESNTEAVNGGVQDLPSTGTATQSVPRNIKVREIFYSSPDRNRVIRCVALTQEIYQAVVDGTAAQTIPDPITSGNTLQLLRANGERRRILFGFDTGLTDGDDT